MNEFIKSELEKPFVWGETDCCFIVNRWCETQLGINLLKNYDRVYKNEEEAREWLKIGILKAVSDVMKFNKISKTKEPKDGDVAIVKLYNSILCMAIKTDKFWFTRMETGVILAPLNSPVIKAWNICHR